MSAVKETLQQQTESLHCGLHDNYVFFQNAGKQLYFSKKLRSRARTRPYIIAPTEFFTLPVASCLYTRSERRRPPQGAQQSCRL